MTAKWYRGYQVVGRREAHIERISTLIRKHDLGSVIPNLHTEKIIKGQRQFYLFLGINTEQKGQIPSQILKILGRITIGLHVGDFIYAEIKSMTSAGIDTEHYRRTLAYRPPVIAAAEDPFDLSKLGSDTAQQTTGEATLALNRLLYWLSATGAGGWTLFRRVCNLLTGETVGLDARHVFRRFRLLGHVEYTGKNGSKWSVCPPALVQSSQPDRYFLAGQRAPRLLVRLSELAEVETRPQPTGEAPDLVEVQFDSAETARQFINNKQPGLRWAGSASTRLATVLPDLAGYQSSLTPVSGFVLSNFTVEQWQGQAYIETHFQQQTGLYRLTPRDGNARMSPQTLFFDAATDQWRSGPWYDLRYLALQAADEPCLVQYHPEQQRLSIPANYRWPDLYERALVLASGLLPLRSPNNNWFYFGGISINLAQTLTNKLNAALEIVS